MGRSGNLYNWFYIIHTVIRTVSWFVHISEIIKKAQKVQNVNRRNLWSCDQEIKPKAWDTSETFVRICIYGVGSFSSEEY